MFDTEALGPVFSFDPSGHLPLKGFASFFSRRHIFLSACYRSSLVAHHVGCMIGINMCVRLPWGPSANSWMADQSLAINGCRCGNGGGRGGSYKMLGSCCA